MHMRQSIGALTEAVSGLKESRTQQNQKLDKISEDISEIKTKIYAAVAIVLLVGGLLGIFGKPIVDTIFNRLSPPPAQVVAPAPQVPASEPTPVKNR
jgi:hypothetical protein